MNYKKIIKSDILETISKIADENNYEIFIVGGYVRDSILGKKAKKDIDILVLGNGIEFANLVALNLKIKIQVFKNFGTAMIDWEGVSLEFIGERKESYSPESRNPEVVPGSLEDAQNRVKGETPKSEF